METLTLSRMWNCRCAAAGRVSVQSVPAGYTETEHTEQYYKLASEQLECSFEFAPGRTEQQPWERTSMIYMDRKSALVQLL